MALTATSTTNTIKAIIKALNMDTPVVISISPNKLNIIYSLTKKLEIEQSLLSVATRLLERRVNMERTIIFCRTYRECCDVDRYFKSYLGPSFTDIEDLAQFRLVDMFTRCTHTSTKDIIMKRFTSTSSLCVVIATIAFGMGVNCPDVHQSIHWAVGFQGFLETGQAPTIAYS